MTSLSYYKNMLRYGSRYLLRDNALILHRRAEELHSNVKLSSPSQSELSGAMILRSIKYAVQTIPFYSQFEAIVSEGTENNAFQVIQRLPVITKKNLLENRSAFYPKNGKKSLWWSVGKTSGTTGTPLEIFRSYNSILYENAFLRRHWKWSGFKHKDRRATLRGDLIVPVNQSRPPFWFYNFYDNQLLISSRHLTDECMPWIVEKVEEFSPKILEAYPSSAYELAKYLESINRMIQIPYVYTGSEMLYAHQRELIEKCFGSLVMDFYGMAERVAFASECEFGNLHLNTDYSFVEILDENNKPTSGYGYVVGTTFHNQAMPLIRYKISDITKWKKGECKCGRKFPMIEAIQGKFEDILYGGSGNPVSPSVITFAFKGLSNIKRSQVAQVDKTTWEVRVVPGKDYSEEISKKLVENVKTMVDPTVEVTVRLIDEIPKTASGKFRWVVNEWYTNETSKA